MGTLEDNKEGYTRSRIDRDDVIENLRGRRYLSIEGIADDTCIGTNAMHFSKAAQRLAVHIEEVVSYHLI